MKKIVLMFSMLFTMTIFSMSIMLLPVLAEDPIDGTFNSTGFNNPTEYTKFTIHELSAFGADNGDIVNDNNSLTPQQFYRFTLGVRDEDSLNDIESIQVHFYYVTFDEDALTNDEGTYVVLEWVKGDNGFVVTDGGMTTTTWVVSNSAIPTLTDKEGDFSFDLQISKVARYSTSGQWKVGLVVVDGVVAEGYEPKAVSHAAIGVTDSEDPLTGTASTFNMDWYGEIELSANNALWTGVFPNMDFDDEGALVTLSGVTYISNGNYDREIKADEVWNISGPAAADGSTQAALTVELTDVGAGADPASTQLFALKVSDQDSPSLPTGTNGLVPLAEATVAFATDKPFTTEAGVEVEVYLWLAISSRFQNATYTGEIVLSVVNTTN